MRVSISWNMKQILEWLWARVIAPQSVWGVLFELIFGSCVAFIFVRLVLKSF